MRLSELARGVPGAVVRRGPDYEVERVLQDSREARPGDLFVAFKGISVDGHDFAAQAAQRGAAVALERDLELGEETAVLHLDRSRWGMGELAAELAGRPARTLRMAGVTGTDGKTTTTHLAAHVLNCSGIEAGYLSTIDFGLGATIRDNLSGHTTVESPALQQMLAGMREGGALAAVVEATSHALVQDRVAACDFDVAAVTNIGFDHLDYHHTWAAYAAAKAGLLELAAGAYAKGLPKTAVINRDDAGHETLARIPIERRWTYSLLHAEADLSADQVREFEGGSSFRLHTPLGSARVDLRLPARFNIYNALCAAGVGLALGADL
ncbi:MAG: Mur ligase family protein, partial [Candidatus Dormibacteraceae bacterium]